MGEVGQLNDLTHTVRTVSFSRSYQDRVVLARPPTFDGGDTSVVRITQVTSTGFSFYVHEAPNKDGPHTTETVSYLVLEAGSWQLPDGTLLEAGHLTTSAQVGYNVTNTWARVDLGSSLTSTPLVFTQVQSNSNPAWVKTRQTNTTTSKFLCALEEADNGASHGSEKIGWLAMEPGSGSWSGHAYQATQTGNSVTDAWSQIAYSQGFAQAPNFLASLATFDGKDSAQLRYRSNTASGIQVKVEEDTTTDAEVAHTTEVVTFLAIEGSGTLSALAQ